MVVVESMESGDDGVDDGTYGDVHEGESSFVYHGSCDVDDDDDDVGDDHQMVVEE